MRIELLNPKNDYVFKRIFGHIGNEEITKQMLQTIITYEIKDIKLNESKLLEKDLLDDKLGIVDIYAKLNENINVDIEMQVAKKSNIEKRMLYYWSKLYTKELKAGEDYSKLHKTIAILIANFKINELKEIPKFCTKWQIREEEYTSVILTDVLEIYIIEIPKIKEDKGIARKELKEWLTFLENPEKMEMIGMSSENKEAIKKAKKVLEEISADEHERYLAHLREKYIRDSKSIEKYGYDNGLDDGIKQGIEKGLQQGIEKGFKNGLDDGIKQGVEKVAKAMLKQKFTIENIMSVTGLTKEEIEKLK